MAIPLPTSEPAALRAGDTATWLKSLPDFPAGAGWSLEYTLINATGKITITSTAQGNDHKIRVLPATTTGWAAGTYAWQCRATDGTDTVTIATGNLEIKPNFAGLTTSDQRSFAQKTLAALEAWIENHDPGVAEYEIAGRRMKYIPVTDLLKLRSQFEIEVNRQAGKSGRILMRS